MVDLLMRERIGLLDAAGPITPMGAAVRRLVPRHTRTYYLALNSSLQVRHLRNSSVRRSAIEDCLGGNSTTDEVTSLMELEIPRASCPPQSTQVVSDRLHLLGPELTDAQLTEFRSNLVGTLLQGWTTR